MESARAHSYSSVRRYSSFQSLAVMTSFGCTSAPDCFRERFPALRVFLQVARLVAPQLPIPPDLRSAVQQCLGMAEVNGRGACAPKFYFES